MYSPIEAFIEYVAFVAQEQLTFSPAYDSNSNIGRSLVLPSSKADYRATGTDDRMHIDMGLARAKLGDRVGVERGSFLHYELLGVPEFKVNGSDKGFEEALRQLLIYTHQVCQQQQHYHLRFAWGIIVSGSTT
ncbi:hypothetical protein H4S07_005369 [Coemansia furcata]|uniref:Uncharacterized protein n=1 Tax=Coemansia furcata TaxID=417177 RepID=A0ACC1L1Q0_9FUNG|nr:hypothetical protein H4S07_005369 [Coemansia furcata]